MKKIKPVMFIIKKKGRDVLRILLEEDLSLFLMLLKIV
jgi:hypothetical protein